MWKVNNSEIIELELLCSSRNKWTIKITIPVCDKDETDMDYEELEQIFRWIDDICENVAFKIAPLKDRWRRRKHNRVWEEKIFSHIIAYTIMKLLFKLPQNIITSTWQLNIFLFGSPFNLLISSYFIKKWIKLPYEIQTFESYNECKFDP